MSEVNQSSGDFPNELGLYCNEVIHCRPTNFSDMTTDEKFEIYKEEHRKELGSTLYCDHFPEEENWESHINENEAKDPEWEGLLGNNDSSKFYTYQPGCLWNANKLSFEIWDSKEVYEAIHRMHESNWSRRYFNIVISAVSKLLKQHAIENELPEYNTKHLNSKVSAIASWACNSYCFYQTDCWVSAISKSQSSTVAYKPVDISTVKIDEPVKKAVVVKKRTLTKEGALNRKIAMEIARMKKSGMILDLEESYNDKDRAK